MKPLSISSSPHFAATYDVTASKNQPNQATDFEALVQSVGLKSKTFASEGLRTRSQLVAVGQASIQFWDSIQSLGLTRLRLPNGEQFANDLDGWETFQISLSNMTEKEPKQTAQINALKWDNDQARPIPLIQDVNGFRLKYPERTIMYSSTVIDELKSLNIQA
jgi:hypothetical protein